MKENLITFWKSFKIIYLAYPRYVIGRLVGGVLNSMLSFFDIWAFAMLIDLLVDYVSDVQINVNDLYFWFGMLVLSWLARHVEQSLANYFSQVYSRFFVYHADNLVTNKLNSISTKTVESSDFQDHLQNIKTHSINSFQQNADMARFLLMYFMDFVFALVTIAWGNLWIALFIILMSVPEIVFNLFKNREYRLVNLDLSLKYRENSYFTGYAQSVTNYFILKSFNLYEFFIQKIKKSQDSILKTLLDYHVPTSFKGGSLGAVVNLVGRYLPQGYFLYQVIARQISVGTFQFYISVVNRLFNSTYHFSSTFIKITENNMYVKDLIDFLELEDDPKVDNRFSEIKFESLVIKDLSFKYPESDKLVLRNIDLSLNKGEKLAIVGKNGAGKSTLIRLITKFYNPTSGNILINNQNLNKIDDEFWRDQITLFIQTVPRFYLSLEENVKIGKFGSDFDSDKFWSSVRESVLNDDISGLPNKEKTMLGKYFPEGVNLSGGQWQKLGIARSLYRDSDLIILDEPTSSIDSTAEKQIFDNLFNKKDKSMIIISHRFSTVRKADKIIVIDNGEIIERGNHEELIKLGGLYKKMYEEQAEGYQ